jgi:hypothetical protein
MARHRAAKVECLFIWIFEDKHPANQQRNCLLSGDTKQRSIAGDTGDFARCPTTARIVALAAMTCRNPSIMGASMITRGVGFGRQALSMRWMITVELPACLEVARELLVLKICAD